MYIDYKVIDCFINGRIVGRWYTIIHVPELKKQGLKEAFLRNLGVDFAEIRGDNIVIPVYIREFEIQRAYRKTLKHANKEVKVEVKQ